MGDLRLFYQRPELERHATRVIATGSLDGRPWARLDETLFYPEGGGQPADRGRIGEAEVVDVLARPEGVLHLLDREIAVGPVETVLDTRRRFDHCQQHTAQHLLTAVLLDRHGLKTTSFHLGVDHTAIEVDGAVPPRELVRRFENEVNAHLREDRRVSARWVEPEELPSLDVRSRGLPDGHTGPVRLVEIEGLDLNTCGGTHVRRLGEVQAIEIVGVEAARGGTRIRFLAGGRVLSDLDRRRDLESALKTRIGTAPDEFPVVLDGWEAERKRLERRVRALEAEVAESVAERLARRPGSVVCEVRSGTGPDGLRALAAAVLARRPDATIVLAGDTGESDGACFLVQAGSQGPADVAALGERVRQALRAKGGGKGKTFQGKQGRAIDAEALERLAGERS